MTEKRAKRIDDDAVIARMGKMQTFNASVFAVLMDVEHNSAYQWIKRNTGKSVGKDKDTLISWTYDNRLGAMIIPRDQLISGLLELYI